MSPEMAVLIAFAVVCFIVFGGKRFVRQHRLHRERAVVAEEAGAVAPAGSVKYLVGAVVAVAGLLILSSCTLIPTGPGADRFYIGWAGQVGEPATAALMVPVVDAVERPTSTDGHLHGWAP